MKCGPDECPIVAFSDLTPAEQRVQRQRIAEKMANQGFTQERIAKQLGVSQWTISQDLRGLEVTSKPPRPHGGRPRGKPEPRLPSPELKSRNEKIVAIADAGKPVTEIAAEFDLVPRHIHRIIRDRDLEINREDLSMSAQQKLDAAMRQHQSKLDAEFHRAVNNRVKEFLEETILPNHRKEQDQARQVMNARKGVMDKATFNKIRRGLHPDSRNSISDKVLGEAFDTFMSLEKLLLDEKNSPTDYVKLPSTVAEWEKMRKKPRYESSAVRPR